MAYPAFRAAGALTNIPIAGGGNGNLPKPAGTAENDFLLLLFESTTGSTVATLNLPSGFTLGDIENNGAFDNGFAWAWKIAGASEPSTYPLSQATSSSSTARAVMLAYSSVDTSTPIDATGDLLGDTSNDTTVALADVTTTVAETLLIQLPWEYKTRTRTYTAGGSASLDWESNAAGFSFAAISEQIASASSVTGRTATASAAGQFKTFALALRGTGGGGGSAVAALMNHYRRRRA